MTMSTWTPRHLRQANRSGTLDTAKKQAFRRCKRISDQFIHQSASALSSPKLAQRYAHYSEQIRKGNGFRKG